MIVLLIMFFWAGGACVTLVPSVTEYFPELKGDLTKVIWAHAVNSQELLTRALQDNNVMMLEADVVLGVLEGQDEVIPIMAHPPKFSSDLSLQMFLQALVQFQKNKRKGVKLDFKSIESFNASWEYIDSIKTEINFPFFLNADIISGPVNSTTKPVDPGVFLKSTSMKFPESTLSLGWTTNYGPNTEGNYTQEQLDAMRMAIESNNILQPVTLCIRAGIAAQSVHIQELLESIDQFQKGNNTTVTVWMSTDSDPVNIPKLRELILSLNKSKVYLDVPKFISDELALDSGKTFAAQGALVAVLRSISSIFSGIFKVGAYF